MAFIVIDNYDSFTYNLVHYLGELGAELMVRRNDKISVDDVMDLDPEGIVLSPGPCTPNEAGICLDLIERAGVKVGHARQRISAVLAGQMEPKEGLDKSVEEIYREVPALAAFKQ